MWRGTVMKIFVPEICCQSRTLPASGITTHTLKLSMGVCIGRQVENTVSTHMHTTLQLAELQNCHTDALRCFFVLSFSRLWTEEATGTLAVLIFSCCSLFFSCVVTSPTVSPSYFMKSFCQAGNPAVLHYSYCAMETGESEAPTTTLMTCKDGVKTLQRLHMLSPILSQLLWSWSWRWES